MATYVTGDVLNYFYTKIKTMIDGKAASSHTHKYAGSASAGGSANSAVKLDTSAGSTTQPVYFKDGVPTEIGYTVAKSVPSDAKFTDTTYSNMTAATASAAGTSGLVPAPAAGKQSSFLRGDGTWAVPTDTKVTNTLGTTTKFYVTGTTSATTATGGQYFDTGVYVSTTAGELVATTFTGALNGNASTASQIYSTLTNPTTGTTYYIPFHATASSANKSILNNNGLAYYTLEGTASAQGYSMLKLGNSTASGTAGNKYGCLFIYNSSSGYTLVRGKTSTSNYTVYLPAANANLAYVDTDTAAGSATNPVYAASSGKLTACTYSLNKTVPSDALFTDKNVYFSETTTANYRPIMLGTTHSTTVADMTLTTTGQLYAADNVGVQASTGTIFATKFSGALTGNVTGNVTGNADTAGYTWTCVTTVGKYSRICALTSYSNWIISIGISQSSQVSYFSFLVGVGYKTATIQQIDQSGYSSYSAHDVRVTWYSDSGVYVEVKNTYGANSVTTVNCTCRAIKLTNTGNITKYTAYTSGESSETIYDSVTTDYRFSLYDKKHIQYGTDEPATGFVGTPKVGDIYIVIGED